MTSLESGFVLGSVRRLTYNFVALSACRSPIVHMLASASATAVATVRKTSVIACAPIICILFIRAMPLHPQACLQTFEA